MSKTFDFYELIFHNKYDDDVVEDSTAPDRENAVFKAVVKAEVDELVLTKPDNSNYVYKVIYFCKSHYKISVLFDEE